MSAVLRRGPVIRGTQVPGLLAAAVAELVWRYSGDAEVALVVLGGGEQDRALAFTPDASLAPAAAAEAMVRAADGPAADEAAADPLGGDASARFAVAISAGDRVPSRHGARLQAAVVWTKGRAALHVAADPRWLGRESLVTFARRLTALLSAAVAHPRRPLRDAALLTVREERLLIGAWAGRRMPYPAQRSLSALLREAAGRRPAAVAVDDGVHRLTYAELVSQAARLAALLADRGVTRGTRVGVMLERSAAQTVALAGVLEAGATVVPLDASLPVHRLRRMAAIAEVGAIVASPATQAAAAEVATAGACGPVLLLPPVGEPAPPPPPLATRARAGGAHPAYVLFTSGSTGEPKGVVVPHRSVVRLVEHGETRVRATDRVLGQAPLTFDVAMFETWGALVHGATLVHGPAGMPSLDELTARIADARVTVACLTPGVFREVVRAHLDRLATLRLALIAGEAMPPREAVLAARRFPRLRVVNGYGPTENNYTTTYRVRRSDPEDRPVPIGRPLDNTTVYVCDAQGRLVAPGTVGELCTGGDGLAIGYAGRPDLTAERFVTLRLPGGKRERVYRTGDLARHRTDGTLEFLGRADAQVKVRGFRVELEEVEHVLTAAPGVASAAVAAVGEGAARRLRAALVLAAGGDATPLAAVRAFAAERLPAYMVPDEVVLLPRLPFTPHGKVDRRAIAAAAPAPWPGGVASAAPVAPAAGRARELEATLVAIYRDLLGVAEVDRAAGFFEVGGTSLLALRLVEEVRQRLGIALPVVRVFEFPSVARLAAFLARREVGAPEPGEVPSPDRAPRGGPIAVIGVAGRFPGADSPDALWTLLREGREGLRTFRREELDASIAERAAPQYVPVRGVLDDVAGFDAAFFGMSPRAAEVMDPQQRLLLEAAWQAFEDAGVVPGDDDRRTTGVFAGVSHDGYEAVVRADEARVAALGDAAVLFANDKDYAALHIAHRLDLRGPAMAVQTSSSTSLTAVAMAVQALRAGQCDLALAGGAAVTVPVESGHLHVEGGMFSADGHTRAFDAAASGTVFSDGAAMLLLERLEDAERAGRRILGVIHGVGVTNDGAARASFSAPTVEGQARCIARALDDAGWRADSVSCVEAHGTGTPLGDPVEMEALTRAFRAHTDRRRFCWIGSLKSNIGHLTAGAGAASVIKVLLAMRHRWIPATLHVTAPNPRIDFEASPFLLAREGVAWDADGAPRRAGVSSFGVGGTNVHVLLEEYVPRRPSGAVPSTAAASAPAAWPHLLLLSARGDDAARRRARDVAATMRAEAPPLAGVARTLREGRRRFERRAIVVAADAEEAIAQLEALARGEGAVGRAGAGRDAVLLFPGQGAQTPGAGRALYAAHPGIRAAIDRCAAAAGPLHGRPLTHWCFATEAEAPGIGERLRETDLAQPVLFALAYALGRAALDAGLHPRAMVGHSIGEFAAAALAGVMTPEDAMRAVVARGALMHAMPRGAMLAVGAPAAQLATALPAGVVVAAHNAPRLCVVAGPEDAIARAAADLEAQGLAVRRLATSHAFHSPAMDAAAERFGAFMRGVALRAPERPFVSCVTGAPITDAEATDPAYWGRQLREPVRFADGLRAAAGPDPVALVETGPRRTLTTLGLQVLAGRAVGAALLPADEPEEAAWVAAFGTLWREGIDGLTWPVPDADFGARPVKLPGYPFERRRCWIEASPVRAARSSASAGAGGVRGLLQDQLRLVQDQLAVLHEVARRARPEGSA